MKSLIILHMQDEIGLALNQGPFSFFRPPGLETPAGLRSGVVKDNMLYALGAYSGMLYSFLLPQLSLVCCRSCVGRYPFKLQLEGDNFYIACADSDTVHMLSLKEGEHRFSYHTGGYLTAMAVSPKFCMLCTSNTRRLFLLSSSQLYPIREMALPLQPNCAIYDEEKDIFYICGTAEDGIQGELCIFSGEGELLKLCQTGSVPVDMALYREQLLISCSGQDVIALHMRGDGRTLGWIKGPVMPDRLAICPQTSRLYVSSQLEDIVEIIDINGRKSLYCLKTAREPSAIIIYP